jgi:hypothetical protein
MAVAAAALAHCVHAAHDGMPENLAKYDQRAMYRVLDFLGLNRRSYLPASTPAGAKKRRQRQQRAIAPIVAAEREHLESEVAAGRMVRVSEWAYVNID